MHGREKRDTRSEKDIVSDGHRTAVQAREVEIGIEIFPDRGKAAIIELNRPLQKEGIPGNSKLMQNFRTPLICLGKPVILQAETMRLCPKSGQLFIRRIVQFSRQHFFLFIHHCLLLILITGNCLLFFLQAITCDSAFLPVIVR